MMTLAEFLRPASKNEEFEIQLDSVQLVGHYNKDELLSGLVPDVPNADNVQVNMFYSLGESARYTYTVVYCKEVKDVEEFED